MTRYGCVCDFSQRGGWKAASGRPSCSEAHLRHVMVNNLQAIPTHHFEKWTRPTAGYRGTQESHLKTKAMDNRLAQRFRGYTIHCTAMIALRHDLVLQPASDSGH